MVNYTGEICCYGGLIDTDMIVDQRYAGATRQVLYVAHLLWARIYYGRNTKWISGSI